MQLQRVYRSGGVGKLLTSRVCQRHRYAQHHYLCKRHRLRWLELFGSIIYVEWIDHRVDDWVDEWFSEWEHHCECHVCSRQRDHVAWKRWRQRYNECGNELNGGDDLGGDNVSIVELGAAGTHGRVGCSGPWP